MANYYLIIFLSLLITFENVSASTSTNEEQEKLISSIASADQIYKKKDYQTALNTLGNIYNIIDLYKKSKSKEDDNNLEKSFLIYFGSRFFLSVTEEDLQKAKSRAKPATRTASSFLEAYEQKYPKNPKNCTSEHAEIFEMILRLNRSVVLTQFQLKAFKFFAIAVKKLIICEDKIARFYKTVSSSSQLFDHIFKPFREKMVSDCSSVFATIAPLEQAYNALVETKSKSFSCCDFVTHYAYIKINSGILTTGHNWKSKPEESKKQLLEILGFSDRFIPYYFQNYYKLHHNTFKERLKLAQTTTMTGYANLIRQTCPAAQGADIHRWIKNLCRHEDLIVQFYNQSTNAVSDSIQHVLGCKVGDLDLKYQEVSSNLERLQFPHLFLIEQLPQSNSYRMFALGIMSSYVTTNLLSGDKLKTTNLIQAKIHLENAITQGTRFIGSILKSQTEIENDFFKHSVELFESTMNCFERLIQLHCDGNQIHEASKSWQQSFQLDDRILKWLATRNKGSYTNLPKLLAEARFSAFRRRVGFFVNKVRPLTKGEKEVTYRKIKELLELIKSNKSLHKRAQNFMRINQVENVRNNTPSQIQGRKNPRYGKKVRAVQKENELLQHTKDLKKQIELVPAGSSEEITFRLGHISYWNQYGLVHFNRTKNMNDFVQHQKTGIEFTAELEQTLSRKLGIEKEAKNFTIDDLYRIYKELNNHSTKESLECQLGFICGFFFNTGDYESCLKRIAAFEKHFGILSKKIKKLQAVIELVNGNPEPWHKWSQAEQEIVRQQRKAKKQKAKEKQEKLVQEIKDRQHERAEELKKQQKLAEEREQKQASKAKPIINHEPTISTSDYSEPYETKRTPVEKPKQKRIHWADIPMQYVRPGGYNPRPVKTGSQTTATLPEKKPAFPVSKTVFDLYNSLMGKSPKMSSDDAVTFLEGFGLKSGGGKGSHKKCTFIGGARLYNNSGKLIYTLPDLKQFMTVVPEWKGKKIPDYMAKALKHVLQTIGITRVTKRSNISDTSK